VGEGTLPWSTYATFDSLTGAFRRGDWNRSAYFAADLGHYVGDGHMPLHITANYNGQKTGQTGVHSRYETSMISRYEDQLVYQTDSARYITGDIQNYIFQYLYLNYKYVDSILIADEDASSLSGSTSSSAYYGFLWERTGTFTTGLMKRGSQTLGDLIYTAWVKAGSPVFNPNAIGELGNGSVFYAVYPNPAGGIVHFPVYSNGRGEPVTLEIFDAKGQLAEIIEGKNPAPGLNDYSLETNNLKAGVYFCRIKMGTASASRRFVVAP
ncbi:MAG TPA: T9SS type A sorting domain-containing protein, partial [Bacteroidales bacterium]|nr:T9SS type A sorting domain-containing protein [Bacteroidales bacterium]